MAAGLAGVTLVPLTLAFFAGRLMSYSLWVGAAGVASRRLGDVLLDSLRSPRGVALQLVMLAPLVALVRVDWARLPERRSVHRRDGVRRNASGR